MPIRIGVTGAGVMGADHIKNLSTTVRGAEVTFVADLEAGRAGAAAPPSARITTDPSELINSSEVDAVVIASHDSTHAGLLLGTPITEVSWQAGRSSRHSPGDLQDPALMVLRTADGTLATLELFLNAQYGYTTRCEIVSESGTAALPEPAALAVQQDGQQRSDIPADWRPRFADAYRLQLQAWISALEHGEPSTLATGEDGLRASQVAQTMIRSLHSDGAITKVIY